MENTHRCSQSIFFPALWIASFVNNFLVITGTSNYFGVVLKGVYILHFCADSFNYSAPLQHRMKYNHNKGLLAPQVIANCEDGMLKSAVKNSLYSLTSTQSNPPVAIVAVLERLLFLSAESHL